MTPCVYPGCGAWVTGHGKCGLHRIEFDRMYFADNDRSVRGRLRDQAYTLGVEIPQPKRLLVIRVDGELGAAPPREAGSTKSNQWEDEHQHYVLKGWES